MEESKKFSQAVIGGIVVLVLAVAAYGLFRYFKKSSSVVIQTPANTSNTTTTTQPPNMPPPAMMNRMMGFVSTYRDGTYSAVGDYFSPGGAEQIGVTLTLKDDVIVEASAVSKNQKPNSIKF